MKDLQKIKEFFSKPVKEERDIYDEIANEEFGMDYNQLGPNEKEWVRDEVSNMDEAIKMKEVMDMNDPVLVQYRAMKSDNDRLATQYADRDARSKSNKNFNKISALKKYRAQLMIDMEQEAEPQGGPIADRYGRELNKIDQAISMLSETKKETGVDMAKKQLDALGIKYEMSGNKFKPFKAIYKPYNEDLDALYDQEYELTRIYQNDKGKENWEKLSQIREKGKRLEEFEDIIDLFNLGSAVKPSMSEGKLSERIDFDEVLNLRAIKVEIEDEITQLRMEMEDEGDESKANYYGGKLNKLENRLAKVKKQLDDYDMNEAKFQSGMLSGKDFINAKFKNYPKAVAKVNQLIDMIGESKFTIEMAEWIFDFFNNASFERPVNEAKKEDKVDTITMDIPLFLRMLEYSREDASQDMDLHDVTEKAISLGKERGILQMDDYDELIGSAEEIKEEQLSFISKARAKSSLKQFLSGKRDDGMGRFDAIVYGIDSDGKKHQIKYYNHLQDYEKFALGNNPDIKENVAPNHDGKAAPYGSGYKPLEERIAKALDKINEELCPAGKAYIKRRQAAGEKSSAYLSGRAVKVCKGQMSGRAKKK